VPKTLMGVTLLTWIACAALNDDAPGEHFPTDRCSRKSKAGKDLTPSPFTASVASVLWQ